MSADQKRTIFNNEEGQALFEAMIFIPILLYMVVMLITVGNSINASINQNKATRTYTFYILKGNSDGIGGNDIRSLSGTFTEVGGFMIGWNKTLQSNSTPISSSFKIPTLPWAAAEDENCEEAGDPEDTNCIKVFTLFGVCGETFTKPGDVLFRANDATILSPVTSCSYK